MVVTIIIIKRLSRALIYRTRWEHRALCNNTNNTHTHTHASGMGIGTAVKNSLEIVIIISNGCTFHLISTTVFTKAVHGIGAEVSVCFSC